MTSQGLLVGISPAVCVQSPGGESTHMLPDTLLHCGVHSAVEVRNPELNCLRAAGFESPVYGSYLQVVPAFLAALWLWLYLLCLPHSFSNIKSLCLSFPLSREPQLQDCTHHTTHEPAIFTGSLLQRLYFQSKSQSQAERGLGCENINWGRGAQFLAYIFFI